MKQNISSTKSKEIKKMISKELKIFDSEEAYIPTKVVELDAEMTTIKTEIRIIWKRDPSEIERIYNIRKQQIQFY